MYIAPRSISKKPRYFGTTARGKEGWLKEENFRMKELLRKQNEKKEQFRVGIDEEKKDMQGLVEEREGYIKEVNQLGNQKRKLDTNIDELKTKRVNEHKGLEETIASKSVIIEKAKTQGKKEREVVEEARMLFYKEIEDTQVKLEKEIKQKLTSSNNELGKVQDDIKHLEQERQAFISSNSDMKMEEGKSLEAVRKELANTKENLSSYKEKSESEVILLAQEKKEWVDNVSELRRQADLAKGLISLEKEVERRTALLNSSVESVEKDIQVLKGERLDLLEDKIKDNNESEIRKIEIRDEIKGLEEVVRVSKQLQGKEINVLEIKRFELLGQQGVIEKDIIEANKVLVSEKQKGNSLIKAKRKEQEYEQEKLDFTKRSLGEVTGQLVMLEKTAKELGEYVEKEGNAKVEYVIEKEKLDKVIREKEFASVVTSEMIKEAKEKNTQVDDYKQKITEMSGQLTTSLRNVRLVTEELNERLQGVGADFVFELPPKNIKKIPF